MASKPSCPGFPHAQSWTHLPQIWDWSHPSTHTDTPLSTPLAQTCTPIPTDTPNHSTHSTLYLYTRQKPPYHHAQHPKAYRNIS